MGTSTSRREFLKHTAAGAVALGLGGAAADAARAEAAPAAKRSYDISLAGWSLHRTIGTGEGKTPMLDMPKIARQEFDLGAIELVNSMLASDEPAYLDELAKNAADNNVKILLIMVDGQGNIGGTESQREDAVERHSHWIDIAEYLGGHSIRMNWAGAQKGIETGPQDEIDAFIAGSVPGFKALCDYGEKKGINVIIENHGGPSSYPAHMKKLMEAVNHPRFGTLPDFGNFPADVDRYEATDVLMTYAKAVSAKCHHFDATTGLETTIDYPRMLEIVCDKHGYAGHIGIEYEGHDMSEYDGIRACKALLEKLRTA